MTATGKITAGRIKTGDIIRRYAPYRYWLDFQPVTSVERVDRQIKITRADGKSQFVSPAARFEINCPHRRGAIDLDTGAWHCYACGEDVFDDGALTEYEVTR